MDYDAEDLPGWAEPWEWLLLMESAAAVAREEICRALPEPRKATFKRRRVWTPAENFERNRTPAARARKQRYEARHREARRAAKRRA